MALFLFGALLADRFERRRIMIATQVGQFGVSALLVSLTVGAAVSPLLAGALLSRTSFGWPLLLAGAVKVVYDLLLLIQFRAVKPPEERGA